MVVNKPPLRAVYKCDIARSMEVKLPAIGDIACDRVKQPVTAIAILDAVFY